MDLRSLKIGDRVEIVKNEGADFANLISDLWGDAEVVKIYKNCFKVERIGSRLGITFTYGGLSEYKRFRVSRIIKTYPPIPCNYKVYK